MRGGLSASSGSCRRVASVMRVGADEQAQHLADGAFAADRVPERQMLLDAIPVAATSLVFDHVAGVDEVGDMSWALRSVTPTMAAMSRRRAPGSWAMHSSARAWLVRKLQLLMDSHYKPYSRNKLHVLNF